MTKEKIKMIIPDESERKLFYSDSTADVSQALVGYFRMDFGKFGKEFWNTWHGTNNGLSGNVTFIAEADSLIAELRKNLLKSRSAMTKYIREHDGIQMAASESYKGKGFKFETEHHLFFLRCIPRPGDYDCYCYAYSKAVLEQILAEPEQDETQMIGGISQ